PLNAAAVAAQRTRVGTQGFAVAMRDGKAMFPTIMADPSAPETYYGSGLETLSVLKLDETTASISQGSMQYTAPVPFGTQQRCILPRAAALTKDGKKLCVGCAGDSDLQILDATAAVPRSKTLGTKNVGDAPAAIAIDDDAEQVVSWSQMGRTLTVASFADK